MDLSVINKLTSGAPPENEYEERLKQEGEFEAIGGTAYLAEVAGSVPYAANAIYYAKIIRDKATLRSLIHASTEILRDAYDETVGPTEIVSQSEQKIFRIHDERTCTIRSLVRPSTSRAIDS